eukprot:6195509-Pleurochrysis_carterae.AAC.2
MAQASASQLLTEDGGHALHAQLRNFSPSTSAELHSRSRSQILVFERERLETRRYRGCAAQPRCARAHVCASAPASTAPPARLCVVECSKLSKGAFGRYGEGKDNKVAEERRAEKNRERARGMEKAR